MLFTAARVGSYCIHHINEQLCLVKEKFLRGVFHRSKLNELLSHLLIYAPKTKLTAHSIDGSYETNPNRNTRNMTAC